MKYLINLSVCEVFEFYDILASLKNILCAKSVHDILS